MLALLVGEDLSDLVCYLIQICKYVGLVGYFREGCPLHCRIVSGGGFFSARSHAFLGCAGNFHGHA